MNSLYCPQKEIGSQALLDFHWFGVMPKGFMSVFFELEDSYGFPRATCRSHVQFMYESMEDNYGNLRNDNPIIYHAVSSDDPPGKPLDLLRLVPVNPPYNNPMMLKLSACKGSADYYNTNYNGWQTRHLNKGDSPHTGRSCICSHH